MEKPQLNKPVVAKPVALSRPVPIRPQLPAFQPAPDPIDDGQYTGDPEQDSLVELDQVKAGFRERMEAEQSRFLTATDGSYYFVAAFESGEQVSAFLKAMGLDKGGDLFIDGRALADKCGVELPPASVRYNTSARPDPKLVKLVKKPGE